MYMGYSILVDCMKVTSNLGGFVLLRLDIVLQEVMHFAAECVGAAARKTSSTGQGTEVASGQVGNRL